MKKNALPLVVLCGGFGTRIKPAIGNLPKILAPVGGNSFLSLQLINWIEQGVDEIIFLLGYKSFLIIDEVEKLKREYTIKISYIVEDEPLGTGGAVINFLNQKYISDFILINGDTYIKNFYQQFCENKKKCLLGLKIVNNGQRYGSVSISNEGLVTKFKEKNESQMGAATINAGVLKLSATDLSDYKCKNLSMELEILPSLVERKLLHGIPIDGYFIDIGIPEDYYSFCERIIDFVKDD